MRLARPNPSWLLAGSLVSCASSEFSGGEREVEPPQVAAHAADGSAEAPQEATPRVETETAPPLDRRWAGKVRKVLSRYEGWGRVDDEARWAPTDCAAASPAPVAHLSRSDDPETHGRKLYTLYAMDPEGYRAPGPMWRGESLSGLDQVIVKEAFAPEPVEAGAVDRFQGGAHGLRPAQRDGQYFAAGEHRGLFVMMKAAGNPEGTDAGWVYATVDSDLETVTAVGVIDSCAACHAEAGPGRLFGLPKGDQQPAPAGLGPKSVPNAAPRRP